MDSRDDTFAKSGLRFWMVADRAGVAEVPAFPDTRVGVHYGQSVDVACRRGGHYHRGIAVHGDIDVIPAGVPSLWETKGRDTALVVSVSTELVRSVAEQCDLDPARVEIRNRFQTRDPQIENVAWAIKAEMEAGYPSGRLYLDSLAVALATRLVRAHSSAAPQPGARVGRIPDRKLRTVLAYIDENLSRDVPLAELAEVAGLSLTHFKRCFRESAGVSAHQYLIRRRVEHAKSLLGDTELPVSQIALEAGFAHQSHLARHMRRVLGVSPTALRQALR